MSQDNMRILLKSVKLKPRRKYRLGFFTFTAKILVAQLHFLQ